MANAVTTPASVAWIPDLSTHTQTTKPTRTYNPMAITLQRFMASNTALPNAAASSMGSDNCAV